MSPWRGDSYTTELAFCCSFRYSGQDSSATVLKRLDESLLLAISFACDASAGTRRRDVSEWGDAWPSRGLLGDTGKLSDTGDFKPNTMLKAGSWFLLIVWSDLRNLVKRGRILGGPWYKTLNRGE